MVETAPGACERLGEMVAQVALPQGPSHIAAIVAQPAKAIAIGPRSTHIASTSSAITPRELIP
jgi:hypothetical protein